jgi:hypothetical protein
MFVMVLKKKPKKKKSGYEILFNDLKLIIRKYLKGKKHAGKSKKTKVRKIQG